MHFSFEEAPPTAIPEPFGGGLIDDFVQSLTPWRTGDLGCIQVRHARENPQGGRHEEHEETGATDGEPAVLAAKAVSSEYTIASRQSLVLIQLIQAAIEKRESLLRKLGEQAGLPAGVGLDTPKGELAQRGVAVGRLAFEKFTDQALAREELEPVDLLAARIDMSELLPRVAGDPDYADVEAAAASRDAADVKESLACRDLLDPIGMDGGDSYYSSASDSRSGQHSYGASSHALSGVAGEPAAQVPVPSPLAPPPRLQETADDEYYSDSTHSPVRAIEDAPFKVTSLGNDHLGDQVHGKDDDGDYYSSESYEEEGIGHRVSAVARMRTEELASQRVEYIHKANARQTPLPEPEESLEGFLNSCIKQMREGTQAVLFHPPQSGGMVDQVQLALSPPPEAGLKLEWRSKDGLTGCIHTLDVKEVLYAPAPATAPEYPRHTRFAAVTSDARHEFAIADDVKLQAYVCGLRHLANKPVARDRFLWQRASLLDEDQMRSNPFTSRLMGSKTSEGSEDSLSAGLRKQSGLDGSHRARDSARRGPTLG